jgi:hypothetical protein
MPADSPPPMPGLSPFYAARYRVSAAWSVATVNRSCDSIVESVPRLFATIPTVPLIGEALLIMLLGGEAGLRCGEIMALEWGTMLTWVAVTAGK